MQFLFCQFYLGSAKLNAQAVNPNADEVRILDKPEMSSLKPQTSNYIWICFKQHFSPSILSVCIKVQLTNLML